jgi:aquaporin Z
VKQVLRAHWPEYLIEGAYLGAFMLSACLFGVLLEHPGSPVHQALPDPFLRRLLMGVAMGTTAIGLIYSPWGKQSGAHMNPAVTFTFFRLGKVKTWDAGFYILAQFAGGVMGVMIAEALLGTLLGHPMVNYVATLPGPWGELPAFAGEFLISFIMMTMILHVTNTPALARFTGLFAGVLVALYITLEAPVSGMSLNPARTFASAVPAMQWDAVWIYFTAPTLAMLVASEVYVRTRGMSAVACAKLHHQNGKRCIHCGSGMSGL